MRRSQVSEAVNLAPQSELGCYRLIDKIGEGGMGVVWKALDMRLDREVALKVLPAESAGSPDRLRRFEREAKAVAALNHPNIVTLYSVEEISGVHFITMELVRGESLDERIPPEGLSGDEFFDLAVPLADTLTVSVPVSKSVLSTSVTVAVASMTVSGPPSKYRTGSPGSVITGALR